MSARQAMIVAAERLFAERGIEAVSMREVAAAAGQGNTSAVRYHFGSREDLVDAVFAYRMASIDERRRAYLAARPGWGAEDPRLLLEALIHPLAESIGHDGGESWYARFLHQAVFEPGFEGFARSRREVTGGLKTVIDGLGRHLAGAGLPEPLPALRVLRVMQLVIHALADHEAAVARQEATIPTPALAADLVDLAAAILAAPASVRTTTELRARVLT